MVRSVKGVLFLLLSLFPWGMAVLLKLLVIQGVEVPMGGTTLYGTLVVGYYLGFFVPLATLFFGVSIIADEAEGGTLPYLFGRPIPRKVILISKYLGTVAVLIPLTALSLAGTFFLTALDSGAETIVKDFGTMLLDQATIAVGIFAYTALFSLLGLAFKKPLFWGFFLGFGWENLVAWLPGFLKRLTILFHLHTLLPHSTAPKGLLNLLASSESKLAACLFLAFYLVLFIALSCFLVSRMEAAAVEREGG